MKFVDRLHREIAITAAVLAFSTILAVSGRALLAQGESREVSGLAAAAAIEQTFVDVIEQAEPSVVSIARIKKPAPTPFQEHLNQLDFDLRRRALESDIDRPESPDFLPNEFGTGIIIAPGDDPSERYILTNYHLVTDGPVYGERPGHAETELYVRLANRRGYHAKILAADPRSDLAVLTIDYSELDLRPEDLKPLKLGGVKNIRKGQLVVVLGNPYAMARDGSASASWGIVSNIGRRPAPVGPPDDEETLRKQTMHDFGTLLHLDTRLNLGTSGGALLNLQGELIGITTALAALDGYEKSVGFAVPFDEPTRRVIDTLVRGHEVEYGFLGVSPRDVLQDELQRRFSGSFSQASAVLADRVFPNSPAINAGLQQGDLILEVNGHPVYDRYDLMLYVGRLGPEANAALLVWREKLRREVTLNVNLGKWPVRDDENIIATSARYPAWRGLRVDFPTARYKYFAIPFRIPDAVLVTEVDPRSSAARAELQPGDFISHVDGIPVQTPGEFHRALQGLQGEVRVQLSDGRRVSVLP